MKELKLKRKLTEEEMEELRACKYKAGGDMEYWKVMRRIYADDSDALERIDFEEKYLMSLEAIPHSYPCYHKTRKSYLETVDEFNREAGFVDAEEPKPEMERCLLEEIAAKFGIDVDINGDGMTSMQKYGKK